MHALLQGSVCVLFLVQHIFTVCLLVRSSVCCSFVRSFDPSVRAHLLAWLSVCLHASM